MRELTKDEVCVVLEIIAQAATLLRKYQKEQSFKVHFKQDDSPVTDADYAANDLIVHALRAEFPDIPIVSEELSVEENLSVLKNSNVFWLLDPLDGTWGFINGKDFFSINLALVCNGEPVYGFLDIPMHNVIYFTNHNMECIKKSETHEVILLPQGKKSEKMDVLVSNSRLGEKLQEYLSHFDVASVTPVPAAVKFGLLAEGLGDIYPRFGPTCGWDTAAGHALLRVIGGEVLDFDGNPLRYNVNLLNPNFLAVRVKSFYKGRV